MRRMQLIVQAERSKGTEDSALSVSTGEVEAGRRTRLVTSSAQVAERKIIKLHTTACLYSRTVISCRSGPSAHLRFRTECSLRRPAPAYQTFRG